MNDSPQKNALCSPPKEPATERGTIGVSKYWQMMESRERAEAERKKRIQLEEELLAIQELEKIPPDELEGKRIHSWVLVVINANEIKFVDPPSGDIYELDHNPYVSIESLWNHSNYWVNMKAVSVPEMMFDLTNLEHWEHLLVAEPWHLYCEKLGGGHAGSAKALKHFTMPSSWVPKLEISERGYIEKYPEGRKIIFYKKTKVEKFSENLHHDGTILRVTAYDDYSYEDPIRMVTTFRGRIDCLQKAKHNLRTGSVQEYFDSGRSDFLKKHEYFHDGPSLAVLKMEFHTNGRLDNLSELSMTKSQLNLHFSGRQDRLILYIVEFQPFEMTDSIDDLKNYIKKIITKYDESESSGVEFREFRDNEIFTMFHYKDKIIQERILQSKDNTMESALVKIEQKCRAEVAQLIHEVHSVVGRRHSEKEKINSHDGTKQERVVNT